MVSFLIIANIFMIVAFILKVNQLPPQIPLFYTRAWGESQLVDTWLIVLLPLSLNLLTIFNSFIVNRFFKENILVIKLFRIIDLFLTISITLIFVKIIFLVS